jgi:hypothetical protein
MERGAPARRRPLVLDGRDVTYVLEPADVLLVLTVCTDASHTGLINYRMSLEKLGYDYRVLALGERWGGWRWRTARYIEALERVGERIVVLTDCTDVLFVEPPDELMRRFRQLRVPVAMGAERTVSTGKFRYDLSARRRTHDSYRLRSPDAAYRFPNAGLIVGYTTPLLRLLHANAEAEDDQAGYVELYDERPGLFLLDEETRLFGNLAQHVPLFDPDEEVHERGRWREEWIVDPKSRRRRLRVVSVETGNAPCVLHFSGSNWEAYNEVGHMLLGPIHQDARVSGNQSVKFVVKKPWTSSLRWMVAKP